MEFTDHVWLKHGAHGQPCKLHLKVGSDKLEWRSQCRRNSTRYRPCVSVERCVRRRPPLLCTCAQGKSAMGGGGRATDECRCCTCHERHSCRGKKRVLTRQQPRLQRLVRSEIKPVLYTYTSSVKLERTSLGMGVLQERALRGGCSHRSHITEDVSCRDLPYRRYRKHERWAKTPPQHPCALVLYNCSRSPESRHAAHASLEKQRINVDQVEEELSSCDFRVSPYMWRLTICANTRSSLSLHNSTKTSKRLHAWRRTAERVQGVIGAPAFLS
jgi:hypothetical protein